MVLLRREVQALDAKIGEAERLLRLADPDGYYREGTRAAQVAKSKSAKAAAIEKARPEAAERQRRERLVRLCLLLSSACFAVTTYYPHPHFPERDCCPWLRLEFGVG